MYLEEFGPLQMILSRTQRSSEGTKFEILNQKGQFLAIFSQFFNLTIFLKMGRVHFSILGGNDHQLYVLGNFRRLNLKIKKIGLGPFYRVGWGWLPALFFKVTLGEIHNVSVITDVHSLHAGRSRLLASSQHLLPHHQDMQNSLSTSQGRHVSVLPEP